MIKLNSIKANDENPRTITDARFKKLVESIRQFPAMLALRPIVINQARTILGGNMRYHALMAAGFDEVPDEWVKVAEGLTAEEERRFVIEDNVAFGDWDWDILANGWDESLLFEYGLEVPGVKENVEETPGELMRERFIVPPFSVLDTTHDDWQERKKEWIRVIGDSTATKEGVLYDTGMNNGDNMFAGMESSSNFDPVLAEVLLWWFNLPGGRVIDPFAGEQTKGYVCGVMGMPYTGIELRKEQIEYNSKICSAYEGIKYIQGDSRHIVKLVEADGFDFCFTSPPYYDLEVYSADDLSALGSYEEFVEAFGVIMRGCFLKLADDRFCALKVGEIRDKRTGIYRNFVGDTIRVMQEAGFKYYNELVLVNAIGSLPKRAGRSMDSTRKVGKRHQNVLVFYKGKIANIKRNFGKLTKQTEERDDENNAKVE